jgi:hypothetical protein
MVVDLRPIPAAPTDREIELATRGGKNTTLISTTGPILFEPVHRLYLAQSKSARLRPLHRLTMLAVNPSSTQSMSMRSALPLLGLDVIAAIKTQPDGAALAEVLQHLHSLYHGVFNLSREVCAMLVVGAYIHSPPQA